ncbi:MAG TPA: RHS repeat-associated core domain-containing protein, partial [Isosphaeraceae bacterium]
TVTDGLGHRSVYEHNEAGLVTSITNPLGAVRRKLYDLNGFLILEFDPAGGGTQYEYDGAGHMVGVTDPMGMTSRYEYDQDHKLIGHTNPNAQAFRWVRDERGRVRTALAPGGGRTEYRYDPDGQLVATTDALGNTTRFLLDGRNLVSEVAGPDGSTARYHYNALGQLTAQVDALGHETRYGFDERGSWDLEVRPDGSSSRFRNDADGHVVAAEDREGSTTRYQWDAFHRLIARTDALGHRVTCAYDSEGRIRAVTNERGESARFEYDAAGRLVRWDGFDGRVQRYHYDARDLLVRRHDGAGVEVEFVRDKAGRVVLRRGCDGDTARFAYDAGGRLVRCENAAGAVELTYGPSGQVVEEKQGDVILRRDYDAAGQRIALSIEDFLDYQYEYDANLRLTALHAGRLGHGFAWDPAGRLAAQEHANGATSRYEYDAADRLIGHTVRSPFGRELARFSYRFDRNDQLVEAAETGRGAAAYTYNRRGELTARAGPACAEDYAYDPAGNLVAGPGAALTCGPGNRLLAAGEARFEFDDRGNVVARRDAAGMTAYRYNSENLLTAVVHPDGTETTYAYDPLGRRIRKTHRGQDVHFLWDQDVPLIERAGERVTRYAFFPGSFLPLSMSDGEGDYDFLLNHLGTPTRLLDGHGQVAWSARSTAFGAPVAAEGPVRNPFRFQGQYRDDESGLHYNRWRYYDPGAGRYTTQDPLFVGERENLYRYALNPVNWIDPYGLTCGGKTYETPEDVAAALNRGERNMHASSHEVAQQGANIWLGGSGERITVADRPKSYRSAPKPEEVIGYGRGNRRVSKDGTVIYDRMVLNGRPHSKADFGTDPHGPHIKVEHIPNDQASHIYYP